MAHFFFNIVDGERIDDEEGLELPDLEAAVLEALRSARSMIVEGVWAGHLPLDEYIEIADEVGAILMKVPFWSAVSPVALN